MLSLFKKFNFTLFIFFSSFYALSQTTTVSGTITDPSGQIWANAQICYTEIAPPNSNTNQLTWQGAPLPSQYLQPTCNNANSSGFFSFSLPDNSTITPLGSYASWSVAPNVSVQATTFNLAVSGTTFALSSYINSIITSPSFAAGVGKYGYNDAEISTIPVVGTGYFNTTSNTYRTWTGTNWINSSGGPQFDTGYFVGDSYEACEGMYDNSNCFTTMLKQDSNIPIWIFGEPGGIWPGIARYMYDVYVPSTFGQNFVEFGGPENDANNDTTSPAIPTSCISGMAASIADYCAGLRAAHDLAVNGFTNRIMASNWTVTSGTWAADTGIPLSNFYLFASPGTAMFTTNNGATLTETFTIPANVSEVLLIYTSYNTGGTTNFNATIKVGSSSAVNLTDPCGNGINITTIHCYTRTPSTQGFVPYAIPYTFTPTGSPQTVVVTATNNTTAVLSIQGVSWVNPGVPGTAVVLQRASNTQFTNYAAYNAAANFISQEFAAAGAQDKYVDLVNGVTVNGTTYQYSTAASSTTATASTATTPGVSAAAVANHLNSLGQQVVKNAIEGVASNAGWNIFTSHISKNSSNSITFKTLGPPVVDLSQGPTNYACVLTSASTLVISGCVKQGAFYELNGSSATITTIPIPFNCIATTQTACTVYYWTQTPVSFGTGGNILNAAACPASTLVAATYEYVNPYNAVPVSRGWEISGCGSTAIIGAGSAPTIANTTGTTTVNTGSTNISGSLTSGTTGTITFVLTWAQSLAYLHRGVCSFNDETTAVDTIKTTTANTTTLTASGSVTSGDVISYSCSGY